jgi:hypothetical protein
MLIRQFYGRITQRTLTGNGSDSRGKIGARFGCANCPTTSRRKPGPMAPFKTKLPIELLFFDANF